MYQDFCIYLQTLVEGANSNNGDPAANLQVIFLSININEQDGILVGCVPPAFLFPGGGGSAQPLPQMQTPRRQPPLDAGRVTCDACLKANPPPVNRMTDACKTLPCPKLGLRAVIIFMFNRT